MAGPKPIRTEFGIHWRLESCDKWSKILLQFYQAEVKFQAKSDSLYHIINIGVLLPVVWTVHTNVHRVKTNDLQIHKFPQMIAFYNSSNTWFLQQQYIFA